MPELKPLRPILFIGPPIEVLCDESIWDELEQAGVAGVAPARLSIMDPEGNEPISLVPAPDRVHPRVLAALGDAPAERTLVAPFSPRRDLYEGLPWQLPDLPDRLSAQAEDLHEGLREGARRGFQIHFNDDKGHFMDFPTRRLNLLSRHLCDPDVVSLLVARAVDTAENFPECSAIYLDGVNYRWDIKPGHPDDVFAEKLDDEESRRFASERGISMQRVFDGRARFADRLRSLSPGVAEDLVSNLNGAMGAIEWWLEEPDVVEWLRFKAAAIEWHIASAYAGIKHHRPELQVGVMWRQPAVAALSGYLPRRIRAHSDFQMPKEYWWAGGWAGLKGTVVNWVDTLVEWNDGLSPEQASRWFSAVFDYPLTPGYRVTDYHNEAPQEWFDTAVDDQTRKMIESCGGVDRMVPVVSLEHSGTPLTANELDRLLGVLQRYGVQRYLYASFNSITPDVWSVIAKYGR